MAESSFLLDPSTSPTPAAAQHPCDASGAARGIMRLFARNDIWCTTEMPLRGGRRADLMGIDAKGHVIIVEIKVSRADLTGDAKWTDYLDHCDKFYWGIGTHLDRGILEGEAFLPERCGLIVADGYDAEIIRPAARHPLAPARRKVEVEQLDFPAIAAQHEVERLARTAMRRTTVACDPDCAPWGGEK